ncbi:MAG: tRNA uridine(34) 5-carboxymethylaminomethyl modification radical SAM/GNAT enzyme Elp3 [Candidatus Magasanikbacteria bacterium]|jgi:elongator complex protein 3|nr:tRNA uridine(34) 5-carboxymethylaminomethyl modification radical SAM/GNAT enzyme Elp3 [Candidatus Magasanikbacteria bacterium]
MPITDSQLDEFLLDLVKLQPESKKSFDSCRRKCASRLSICQPSNRQLLKRYRERIENGTLDESATILKFMRKAGIRNSSGIAVITSLLKPYPCPGKCVYCPTETRMPKSYIASEPAAARSLRLDFNPYELMKQRIEMLEGNGHTTDKIEYITKGGTWNAYPLKYQYWYMLESFKACNNPGRETQIAPTNEEEWNDKPLSALQDALAIEKEYNETAPHRLIGVTFETRPDALTPKTMWHMRMQGCTRIELGLQAPDDNILTLIKRGHSVDQFRQAMYWLRRIGFKVDLHFMPDLPGTTPDHDIDMYRSLFSDPSLKPDMVKIYPNTVIESAELYEWLQDGRYTPYGDKGLFSALRQMKLDTPRYCRISRLIRDIPSNEIAAGNEITNLREMLSAQLKKEGLKCECLRCREIARHPVVAKHAKPIELFDDVYETVGGEEHFVTYEDPDRTAVYGFLRLRLPNDSRVTLSEELLQKKEAMFERDMVNHFPDLTDDVAFIRELHVYGNLIGIGKKDADASQHKGHGKRLVAEAERITKEHGFAKLAIISGVGVRGYYRKLGYDLVGSYMVKDL